MTLTLKRDLCIALCTLLFSSVPFAFAHAEYRVDKLPDATVYGDFVVGPGKIEVDIKPGESRVVNLTVANRMGESKLFSIGIEDFTGSRNPEQPVLLLGDAKGPYSLKDYIKVPSMNVEIGHAERVTIPVTIKIPADAEPGGRYGSVVIRTVTKPSDVTGNTGSNALITRIGTLFFVRIPGEEKKDASLKEFTTKGDQTFFASGPVTFNLLFENNGSVHVNPYGKIAIQNILGAPVSDVVVEAWFALPDSLRLREVEYNPPFLFGRYTATARINKGYDDKIDEKVLVFWVLPWRPIALGFIILFVVIASLRYVFSKFTIVKKS